MDARMYSSHTCRTTILGVPRSFSTRSRYLSMMEKSQSYAAGPPGLLIQRIMLSALPRFVWAMAGT
jgi:hypothetical protein